jgi:2'-5' RNA ligase
LQQEEGAYHQTIPFLGSSETAKVDRIQEHLEIKELITKDF